MKTLVIHPFDETTNFLETFYAPIENKTIVRGGMTKDDLKYLIKSHDRVIMCGHGSPFGLFSVGKFPTFNGLIIDSTFVDVLKEKDNNIFIWCNADKFVEHHKLKGFYCGMFISEVGEATWCGYPNTKQEVVDESNASFVNLLSECINEPQRTMFEKVFSGYGDVAENNPIAKYNHQRLYFN